MLAGVFSMTSPVLPIVLEPNVKLVESRIDALGENFEKTSKGFIDFLLLDQKGFPFIVLEAKSEDKNPLTGKEQARSYAKSQNCRFVILIQWEFALFLGLDPRKSTYNHTLPQA
jgi:type I restriction enzyme R subunit